MTTEQRGARFHALLFLNPHLAEIIGSTDTHRSHCAERLLDLLAACESPAEVAELQSKLPHVPFVDVSDTGFVGAIFG